MVDKSIEDLQQTLFYESISRRLHNGQPRGKISSELNITPSALQTLLYSDEFLNVLKRFDEELSESLIQEKLEGENKAYEDVIQESAPAAAQHLKAALTEGGTTASISAAKTIIELAEKIAKKGIEASSSINLPKRQWDILKTTLGEVDQQ